MITAAFYLAFAIPLILIILFGYALSLDVDNVETVFIDYDHSDLSRDFIRKLDASSYFHVSGMLPSTKDVVRYLDEDRARLAIVIPPDCKKNIGADRETPLQLIIDGSAPPFGNRMRGSFSAFVGQYNRKL